MNPFDEARSRITPEAKTSIDLVEAFFDALGRMDFETVGSMFTADGLYRDEPSHEADATGPKAITAKLTNAITGLDRFVMGVDTVVGDADRVTSRRTPASFWLTRYPGLRGGSPLRPRRAVAPPSPLRAERATPVVLRRHRVGSASP